MSVNKGKVVTGKLGNPVAKVMMTDTMIKNAGKVVTGTLILASLVVLPYMYKKWRQKNYASRHAGNPNVQAAMFIRRAITKVEVLFIDKRLWTNEEAIIKSAQRITDISEVAKAYNIMYDSDMFNDIQGLNDRELQIFLDIASRKREQRNLKDTRYLKGTKLYSIKEGILRVSEAKEVNGKWTQTDKNYGSFNFNDEIGEVVGSVVYRQEPFSRFYIVEKGFYGFRSFGLVWDKDVTDRNY